MGSINEVFKLDSDIARYILVGAFEDVQLGGKDVDHGELQSFFKFNVPKSRNAIMIQSLDDGRLKISLNEFHENKSSMPMMVGKETLVIDYKTLDVYNSEY